MSNRHNRTGNKAANVEDNDMSKDAAKANKTRSRKAANNQVNASVKQMYDDVVNEPVPEGISNAIPQDHDNER